MAGTGVRKQRIELSGDKRSQRDDYRRLLDQIHIKSLQQVQSIALGGADEAQLQIGFDSNGTWVLWQSWMDESFDGRRLDRYERREYLAAGAVEAVVAAGNELLAQTEAADWSEISGERFSAS